MTNTKPTTIEIYSVASSRNALHSDETEPQHAQPSSSPDPSSPTSLCIKITDSHGHSNKFLHLPANGPFQKQLLEQSVSIVSQPAKSEKNKHGFIGFFVAHIPAFGILCALISVLCFSFNSVIVKLLKSNYGLSGIQVLVTRALFQFVVFGLVTLVNRKSFLGVPGCRWNLVCRALTGTFSLCCIFTAFNMMPIGDATTIYFSAPVAVTVIAYFMLGEPFRCLQFLTCILTILGVGFISKPEFIFGQTTDIHYPHMLLGQVLAIMATISSSIMLINLRRLKTTPASVVVFWFAASVLFFGTIALYVLGTFKPIDFTDLLCTGLLGTIGLMSISEQYFLTIALQHEDATTISVTRSFNIVLAFLWEVVIFAETVTWTSIVGALLVSACILLLTFSKSWDSMLRSISQGCHFSRQHSIDLEQNCINIASADDVEAIEKYAPTGDSGQSPR